MMMMLLTETSVMHESRKLKCAAQNCYKKIRF